MLLCLLGWVRTEPSWILTAILNKIEIFNFGCHLEFSCHLEKKTKFPGFSTKITSKLENMLGVWKQNLRKEIYHLFKILIMVAILNFNRHLEKKLNFHGSKVRKYLLLHPTSTTTKTTHSLHYSKDVLWMIETNDESIWAIKFLCSLMSTVTKFCMVVKFHMSIIISYWFWTFYCKTICLRSCVYKWPWKIFVFFSYTSEMCIVGIKRFFKGI